MNLTLAVNATILFVWGFGLARVQGVALSAALAAGAMAAGLGAAFVVLKLALH